MIPRPAGGKSQNPLREVYFAMIVLVTIVLVSTTGFHIIEQWPWFDALYMVVITLSTVGYGETHDLTPTGRIWAMLTIFMGVGVMSFTFITLGRLTMLGLVEGEFKRILARRRMNREIEKIEGHYVVCGFGRIGRQVARRLHASHAGCVVIESDAERVPVLESEGVHYLIGDATDDDVLERAGVPRAKGLAIVTPSDPDNLYITLTAREMNARLYILSRYNDPGVRRRLLRAGANNALSPHEIGGRQMANSLLRPTVTELLDLASGVSDDIAMEEISIAAGSQMIGKSLRLSGLRQRFGVIIVAIKRGGEMVFNPTPHEILQEGDNLIAIGHQRDMAELITVLQPGQVLPPTGP